MTIFRIDRSSIRKNVRIIDPDVFNSADHGTQFFSCQVFPYWIEAEHLISLSFDTDDSGAKINFVGAVGGYVTMRMYRNWWLKAKDLGYELKNIYQNPEYDFTYIITPVVCSCCLSFVEISEIEEDLGFDFEETENMQICPVCKSRESFEYRYETIEEALMDM